jgi:hypothetical protein
MAFQRGSRYQDTKRFVTIEDGRPPFPGTRPRDVGVPVGVLEHTVLAGQRLDLLALHYYNDDRKWWRILDANPALAYAGDLALAGYEGTTILIPRPPGGGDE